MDTLVSPDIVESGMFRLERSSGRLLRRDGNGTFAPVQIGSRAFVLLRVLVGHAGEVVTRQAIMDAVWPGTAVDEHNLTVQLAALRRILDTGRAESSCIQTMPGRGYRFVEPVTVPVEPVSALGSADALHPASATPVRASRRAWPWIAVTVCAVVAVLLVAVARPDRWWSTTVTAPRMSLVVLPFDNLGTDPTDSNIVDSITSNLTNDLSRELQVTVAAATSASVYKGQAVDPRQVGRALGVRYVVRGSVRRRETTLSVVVEVASAEMDTVVWSDRFDANEPEGTRERVIVDRLRDGVSAGLIEVEAARSLRERPDNPDAFDLVLRGRAISLTPPSPDRETQELALFERALVLDPSYVPALVASADLLIDSDRIFSSLAVMRRTEARLLRAREIAPEQPNALGEYLFFLRMVGRCPEVIELAQRAMQTIADRGRASESINSSLGFCQMLSGHAEQEILLQQAALEAHPHTAWAFSRYRHMGLASLMLGRDQDAIAYVWKALDLNPGYGQSDVYRWLAAAYARTGQIDMARETLAKADRLWPYMTVRSVNPQYSTNPVYLDQLRRYQDALRLAGERDHADEDADFGVPSNPALHGVVGRTPTDAPGAVTIRTAELPRLLAEGRPIVIDTMTNWWGRSISGAVGLKFVGLGGDFSDEAQDHLRSKMHELTGRDLNRPIVAVGFNSEHFDGRNLALRLVALGYTHVYWYRGGREAWEVAGLPEADAKVDDW
jgi:DNA-binding winged helix-turn-helix (wHTH) protein/TolB-like protein/tetratricopeptide (TPR) repeat protein